MENSMYLNDWKDTYSKGRSVIYAHVLLYSQISPFFQSMYMENYCVHTSNEISYKMKSPVIIVLLSISVLVLSTCASRI